MWEGFPDDGGDRNGPVRPMKVWEIMFNALKDIGELDYGAAGWPDIVKNALNAVDKEWDKLYSKETND